MADSTAGARSDRGTASRAGSGHDVLRIGNASGFYGDRFAAMREMLDGGELDVLTGDYLAELTMLLLGRDTLRDSTLGYAKTFLRQLEDCLGTAVDAGVRIVTNAGGLNPAGLAAAIGGLAERLGIPVTVGHVLGDDLRPRIDELGLGGDGPPPLTANAYLGGWGIAECLRGGANIVVTGRVTDASLVVGPAAAHFGWARDDWNALAGATVAGHVLECGAQATGGNFAFADELTAVDPDALAHPGFPIAEVHADGSAVITKHAGTGGTVTPETVTAQLLYEIDTPAYLGPDVVTRFDTIHLAEDGPDRVRISGVTGTAPPDTLKVCLNTLGGFRNGITFVLCGLDIQGKAALVRRQLEDAVGTQGLTWTLARTDRPDADTEATASALLQCTIKDGDQRRAGRAFSKAGIELALASYPGFHVTAPPSDASPFGVYSARFVPQDAVEHRAVLPGGDEIVVPPPTVDRPADASSDAADPQSPAVPGNPPGGPTRRLPLGSLFGARSGDKGGDANLGVWARTDAAYAWLCAEMDTDRLRELLPEAADLRIDRHPLPNLRAVNFVLRGLLGDGVAASTRFDPQAKALGEWFRARHADIPEALL